MKHRTTVVLIFGILLVSSAALGASGVASGPSAAEARATALVAALRATDGTYESLRDYWQLASNTLAADLSPEQAALMAEGGPVAQNHAALVDEIERIRADGSLSPVEKGHQLAAASTRAQALKLGVELPAVALAGHQTPSAALQALAHSAGVALTDAELQQARALDAIEPTHAQALARVIDAFTTMNDASTRALDANADAPSWGETLGARLALLDAIHDYQLLPPLAMPASAPTSNSWGLYNFDLNGADNTYTTNYVFSFDVGGNDVYLNNAGGNWLGNCGIPTTAAAAVDLGGSDSYSPSYRHNNGATFADACGKNGGSWGGVGFLFDSGGANQFGGGQSQGVNGGAVGAASLGFLASVGGWSDDYRAGSYGTNGGGAQGGVGLLVQAGLGWSSVNGGSYGTNGGAWNGGMGMLINTMSGYHYSGGSGTAGGADGLGSVGFAYSSGGSWNAGWTGTTGGGANGGAGTLVAPFASVSAGGQGVNGGADGLGSTGSLYGPYNAYYSGSYGVNGGGSNGGHGTLVTTTCQCSGSGSYGVNGGGHNLGTGFLYATDGAFYAGGFGANGGADGIAVGSLLVSGLGSWAYSAPGGNGVNGGANNAGLGLLIDAGITPATYTGGSNGANGGARQSGSTGLLIDAGGNDRYLGGSSGVNGAALAAGRGMLVDLSGNDEYTCSGLSTCNGGSADPGAVALLLDAQGHDSYNGVWDQTLLGKGPGLTGAQIDLPAP